MPKLNLEGYNKSVQEILRDEYRITWKKAIEVFGYETIRQWELAGNMASTTAEAIYRKIKNRENE